MRSLRSSPLAVVFVLGLTSAFVLALGCGGPKPATPPSGGDAAARATHPCGDKDKIHKYDLHDEDGDEALVPCSNGGKGDYSGLVHIDTTPEGIKITIHASDDDVTTGALGSELKGRDAVIVYPKGRGSAAVEVPLVHTKDGYVGEKIIPYADLGKLTDDGTKIDVAIFDHDKNSAGADANAPEEMHMSVAVSAGKSCEKAIDENPQTMDMGGKGGASKPDLTDAQLGGPMKDSGFFGSCGLAGSANADICVAVKEGKPLGVSVAVTPANNKVAACIDKATRRLKFPSSDKLDVVKQHF